MDAMQEMNIIYKREIVGSECGIAYNKYQVQKHSNILSFDRVIIYTGCFIQLTPRLQFPK